MNKPKNRSTIIIIIYLTWFCSLSLILTTETWGLEKHTSGLKEWQIKDALCALKDKIPEVRAETLKFLTKYGALNRIPQENVI